MISEATHCKCFFLSQTISYVKTYSLRNKSSDLEFNKESPNPSNLSPSNYEVRAMSVDSTDFFDRGKLK